MDKSYRAGAENTLYRPDLLMVASRAWGDMSEFRRERLRAKRFTFGDQWSDRVPAGGGMVKEEDFIRSQGNLPLKNNLIRRLVRNVLGVWRNQWERPKCKARDPLEESRAAVMQRLLNYNMEINRMEELYARTMEEFLISGIAVHRKWFGRKNGKVECWTEPVNPDNFFIDSRARDFLHRDAEVIGELHDISLTELCARFAADETDYERFRHRYADPRERIRIIELWIKEPEPVYRCHDPYRGEYYLLRAEESDRLPEPGVSSTWGVEEVWRYYYLTQEGEVLRSGRSPYSHGRHPYVVKAYPYIDGEIHSFVSDIIDQQKYTNRLISMYDWVLRASAKGVLLFPEGALPDGLEMEDIAEEWGRFNGVIVFRPRQGVPLPQQVSSNASNAGISELLNIQMKMMEDISGVNGALQGKLDSTSMSGTLYDQQTRNSLTALADLLSTYKDFIMEATGMDVSNIRQFYTPRHIDSILGTVDSLAPDDRFFDPSLDFTIQ